MCVLFEIHESHTAQIDYGAVERRAGHVVLIEFNCYFVFASFAWRERWNKAEIALIGEVTWYATVLDGDFELTCARLGRVNFEFNHLIHDAR